MRHVVPVKQTVTAVTVKFDDTAVADFFDDMVDAGLKPEQFGRIWLHTHPGNSPTPSNVDEDTFADAFGKCQWSVMAIVARDDSTYARLQFGVGPGCQVSIPVKVDYSRPFEASDHAAWAAEYKANVTIEDWRSDFSTRAQVAQQTAGQDFTEDDNEWMDRDLIRSRLPRDFDRLPLAQQLLLLEELGVTGDDLIQQNYENDWSGLSYVYDGDDRFFDEDRINDSRDWKGTEHYGA